MLMVRGALRLQSRHGKASDMGPGELLRKFNMLLKPYTYLSVVGIVAMESDHALNTRMACHSIRPDLKLLSCGADHRLAVSFAQRNV